MAVILVCVLVAVAGKLSAAAKLPPYVHPCPRSEPETFKQCALTSAREAAPFLLPGDRKYRIQRLEPIRITELVIDSHGFVLRMTDLDIVGSSTATIKDVDVDFKKQRFSYTLFQPQCVVLGNYDVKGMVSILPISGRGRLNMTLENMEYTLNLDYELTKQEDGKEYMTFKNNNLDYTITRMYLAMTNLFNGDKFLGDQMNRFFDENWRELEREIGPSLANAISIALSQLMSSVLVHIPFDDIFPPL